MDTVLPVTVSIFAPAMQIVKTNVIIVIKEKVNSAHVINSHKLSHLVNLFYDSHILVSFLNVFLNKMVV